jgi:lipoprotein
MKKLTAAILALLICVFAFASCGSDNNKPSDTTPKTSDVGSKQEETPTKKDNGNETSAPESTREWSDRY